MPEGLPVQVLLTRTLSQADICVSRPCNVETLDDLPFFDVGGKYNMLSSVLILIAYCILLQH